MRGRVYEGVALGVFIRGLGENLAERVRGGHAQLASGTKREARMEGY